MNSNGTHAKARAQGHIGEDVEYAEPWLTEYRAHLAGLASADEIAEEIGKARTRLAVFELTTRADWSGHSELVVRLRLAERALAARPVNVSGSGGANDAGKLKRRSGHARSK